VRVALISPYALNIHGGVQEQVIAMSRALSERGHEVLVVAPNRDDDGHYDTPATVTRVGSLVSVPANGSRAPITLQPSVWREVRAALRTFQPDVVHSHEPFAPIMSWSIRRRHEWPLVATFHRSGGFSALHRLSPLFEGPRRGIDVAVSVSESAARTARSDFGISTTVLFNGIDVASLRRTPREVPDTVSIVTVGRLEERKGVSTLVAAVVRHNEQEPHVPWHLDVVGEGPERTRLEEQAKGSVHIVFHGALNHLEKNALLRRASVIVCPALRGESFGIVLLEAMACEVPVVASDIDGYRQAAGGMCLLAPPGDPIGVGASIERALHMESAAIEAAANYAATWSMASLVERYEGLYRGAIRPDPSR
jgi:phosphatidylinositol alpha-mannosyltransferase